MKEFIKKYSLVILLVLAFLMRLISLNQSLWHDESGTVIAARDANFITLVTKYSEGDFHPPGYFVILWGWIKLFGSTEFAARLPSIIFGVLTILFTFFVGKKIFNEKVGFIGALLLTFSPLHIYYSQEARMYSFAAFVALVSIYGFIKLLNNEKYGGLIFTMGTIFVLYSDYIAYFIIPAQVLYLLFLKREKIKNFYMPYLISFISIIPWLFVFPRQLEVGRRTAQNFIGWSDVVGGISLKSLGIFMAKIVVGRISFDNKYLYALIVGTAIFIYVYLLVPLVKKYNPKNLLLFFCLIIPIILGIGISFFIPVFAYFRYLFILPFLYPLIGVGLEKNKWKAVLLTALLIIEIYCTGQYLFNPNNQREDWKSAVSYVDSQDYNKTLVLFKDVKVLSSYMYYTQKGAHAYRAFNYIPTEGFRYLTPLPYKSANKIIVFDYLTQITDPNKFLEKKIYEEGFKEIKVKDFRGVGFVRVYER